MRQLYYVIRTLLRGRGANFIKIISLGLGLTMSILLLVRVAFELSFDSCYKESDNLYQLFSVWTQNGEKGEPVDMLLGPVAGAILESFPNEIEATTSSCHWRATGPLYKGSIRFDDSKLLVDSLFFQTMGIEVLKGDTRELMNKEVIFLSDRLAKKIFADEEPMGKILMYNKEFPLTVKGVYAALPENTTHPHEAVISMPTLWSAGMNYSWLGGDSYFEYIRFRPGVDKEEVLVRLDAMIQKYLPAEMKEQVGYTVIAKPLRNVYRDFDTVKRMIWMMTVLALAVLFIAALNYVLISISSLAVRAKAVGVHKCSGASRGTVFSMFLWETAIILLLALLLMGLILINFREAIEDTTVARLSSLFTLNHLWIPAVVVLFLFVVGGLLPGQIFSSIPVSQVFRRYADGKKGWKLPLLFVQFAGVSFVGGLLCVVMVQYDYVTHASTGYDARRVVVADTDFITSGNSDYARVFLEGLPFVEAASAASYHPGCGFSGEMISGEDGKALFSSRSCSNMEDYPAMMDMKMKEGRMARSEDEVIVNETFAKRMRWGKEVVGRTVSGNGDSYKVVGVLKDYHVGNFYVEQLPLIVHWTQRFSEAIHLRLKEPFAENLQKLNQLSNETFTNNVVQFYSLEQNLANNYNAVRVFRNATLMAAITIIFIMLMGLIGYTTDEIRRRSKEIAIRKVNGAEASVILRLLIGDVLYVALPAVLFGVGASWYVNGRWLDLFAEKAEFTPLIYLGVILVILTVIVGCVVVKAWRIANENPVNSIKSE